MSCADYEPQPTHVMVGLGPGYSIQQARDELVEVLTSRLGAVFYTDEYTQAHEFYVPLEVIVNNRNILFILKIWRLGAQGRLECVREQAGAAAAEEPAHYCFEMHKLRGDTVEFCKIYTWFVLYCDRHLVVLPQSKEHVANWTVTRRIGHPVGELPEMLLTCDADMPELFDPLVAQVSSPWFTSQAQGIESCASLSATPVVGIMARYAPLTDAIFELLKVPQRDIVRCAATCIANMWVWQAGQADVLQPQFQSCLAVLDRWIADRAREPNWTHALRECRRARVLLAGRPADS